MSQQMATHCSRRTVSATCKLLGKKEKKENPERSKFSIALSALITAITQSLLQALQAIGKMRNSADLLRHSRERRRAFDRNKLSLASAISTLYKG